MRTRLGDLPLPRKMLVVASLWLLPTGFVIVGFNLAVHALGLGRDAAVVVSRVGAGGPPVSAAPPRALSS